MRSYSADPFACNAFDVTTGLAVTRYLNVFIGCNQGGKETDPLNITGYSEQGQCQYFIQTSHKLGCGSPINMHDMTPLAAP